MDSRVSCSGNVAGFLTLWRFLYSIFQSDDFRHRNVCTIGRLSWRHHGPRFTISLKRSTQNLQLSTSSPADYPIYWGHSGQKAVWRLTRYAAIDSKRSSQDRNKVTVPLDFDRHLMLQFRGSVPECRQPPAPRV